MHAIQVNERGPSTEMSQEHGKRAWEKAKAQGCERLKIDIRMVGKSSPHARP